MVWSDSSLEHDKSPIFSPEEFENAFFRVMRSGIYSKKLDKSS